MKYISQITNTGVDAEQSDQSDEPHSLISAFVISFLEII